jgi:putative peptidoglycan lipid II flippase
MLALMVPGTVGLAATQVNILVNSVLATSAGPGAVSWLNYAFRLMQFPIGIFGVSLASATLPRISAQWVDRDVQGVSATLSKSLRQVFAVNLPASAGLAFLGYPIIELLFQYGSFHAEDTRSTAAALAAYAVGLTAYSAVKVLVPACYAFGSTRVAVVSSVSSVAATIVLNLLMVGPLGYVGLALGTSAAAVLNAAFLLHSVRNVLRRAGGDLPLLALARSFGLHLVAALAMGAACWFCHREVIAWIAVPAGVGVALFRAVKVAVFVVLGVALSALLARVFRLQETLEVIDLFKNKLKNKLSPRRN